MTRDQAARQVASLFESWYTCLLSYIYRRGHTLEFAEDIVQEAFLHLYRELCRGGKIENPKGWTLCVARREIIRRQRPHTYEGSKHEPLDVLEMLPAGRVECDELALAWDPLAKLTSILTEREEEVLLLRVEGLTYREIASELGISPNSVGTLVARALRKMRRATHSTFHVEAISTEEKEDVEKRVSKTLQ